MKSPYPLEIPTVKVFQPEELHLIKFPLSYLSAIPPITIGSSYASQLNNLICELDPCAISHTGLDGLPILLKNGKEFIALSGHASIDAAKRLNISIICNVYTQKDFTDITDQISLIKAYLLPLILNLRCLAHRRLPIGTKDPLLEPLPYITAAILENFSGIKSDMREIVSESLFESYEALENFGMASRSTYNRLVKKYRLHEQNTADPKRLGQAAHPELKMK